MTDAERVASRASRGRLLFVLFFAGLAGAVLVLFFRGESTREAACVEHPGGKACQKSKRESDRERTIRDTCIAFWKVGYACPAPDSGITVRARERGDASQPAPAGRQPGSGDPELTGQSPKHRQPGGKDPVDDGDGDQEEGISPPAGQAPEAIDPPGNGKGPPADTPAAEAPGLAGDLTGPIGGAIEDVGKGVDKAACPAVDRLAGLCN